MEKIVLERDISGHLVVPLTKKQGIIQWKINILRPKITTGDFDQMCKIFILATKAANRGKAFPTFNVIRNRRAAINNWKDRDSQEVIRMLVRRGELVIDESRLHTGYFIPKGAEKKAAKSLQTKSVTVL